MGEGILNSEAVPIPSPEARGKAAPFDPVEIVREAYRYCVADPSNPFYRFRLHARSSPPLRSWRRLPERFRFVAVCFACTILVCFAWLMLRRFPLQMHFKIRDWIGPIMAVLVFASYLLPVTRIHLAFRAMVSSGELEPLLVTRLTNVELIRGIVVPELRVVAPLGAAAALVAILWPMSTDFYDFIRRAMMATFFVSVVINAVVMMWIAFGFMVHGAGFQSLLFAVGAMFALDPYLLIWESGLFKVGQAWNPLIFTFSLVELLYCGIKAVWAYLIISDLKTTFRAALTS